jgi:hypothetical protein
MSYALIKNVFPNFVMSHVYENVYKAPPSNIEAYENAEFKPHTPLSNPQDNLRFYNKPVPPQTLAPAPTPSTVPVTALSTVQQTLVPTVDQTPVQQNVETFESDEKECDACVKHMLSCKLCKETIIKQFNLQDGDNKNQEIMELVSYILFGLFVLILLDNLRK